MTGMAVGPWHGRFLLVIAAAAFVFVPMFAGRAAEQTRIGWWEDRGFGRDEPRQWWDHGIPLVSDAVQWRAHGFMPDQAGVWKRMEFIAGEAMEWTDAGFDARTAAEWRREAFEPGLAAAWKAAGFSIGEAVSWRKRAFGPDDAMKWREAGQSPLEAAEQRAARDIR